MSTTTLIVDYLIIGVESSCWMFLLVNTTNKNFLETISVASLKSLPEVFSPIFAGLAIAFVYAIGLVMNVLYNDLFTRFKEKRRRDEIFNRRFQKLDHPPKNWRSVRYFISICNEYIAGRFENWNRSKMRLLRATAANFLLLGVSICIHSILSGPIILQEFNYLVVIIVFALWLLAGLAFWLWNHSMKRYYEGLADAYFLLKKYDPRRI